MSAGKIKVLLSNGPWMKQNIYTQGSPFVQKGGTLWGTAKAMRSQQALGSQQAEVRAGSEVTEVPELRGCRAPQRPSRQSLSTTAAAAAAVAAVVLTLGQRCQDSGGSKSGGTGTGQGTMALALRLLLLLLLAVALPARAAQAAPLQARGADEHARKASPAAWLHEDFQPLKSRAGASAGRTFQAPFLVAEHKSVSHRREMEGEAVLKAEFPRGSSGSLAASAAGREALPGTVTGDWDRDLKRLERVINHGLRILKSGEAEREDEEDLDSQPIPITEPLGDGEGVAAEKTFSGPLVHVARKPSFHRRGPLRGKNKHIGRSKSREESKHLEEILSDLERQHDAAGTSTRADKIWKSMRRDFCRGTSCLMKLMVIVAGAALGLMMCSVGIWYCWKRKWCCCASPGDEPNNSGRENLTCVSSSSRLSPSALPQLLDHLEPFPKQTPPQRDPLPLSPLVLFPSHD
nr:uncharacterized protein LOC115492347 isoform X2 [Taeniopygia guttata]